MKEGGTSVVVGGDHSYGNGPSHVCFLNKRKMKSGIRGFFSGPTNSVNVYSLRWRLAGFVETDQLLDFEDRCDSMMIMFCLGIKF